MKFMLVQLSSKPSPLPGLPRRPGSGLATNILQSIRRLRGHKLGRFDSEWLPWQLSQSRNNFIHIFFSWHHFISEFHKTSNSVPFSAAVPGPFPRIPRNQGLNWLNPSTKQVDHLSPWLVRGSTSSHPLSGSPVEGPRSWWDPPCHKQSYHLGRYGYDNIGDGLGFRVYHIREGDYSLLFRRCFLVILLLACSGLLVYFREPIA